MDLSILKDWVNINSGSDHPDGLKIMADALEQALSELPGTIHRIALDPVTDLDGTLVQPGDSLQFRYQPEAPLQLLLSGHMDTVFGRDHPFQEFQAIDANKAKGPGIADMKGGLFIILESVRRYCADELRPNLGIEILITADEEIGSPASHRLIKASAKRNHLGLVFESALPDGALVSERKGTGTYRMVARGRAAHTGRDFSSGRNAAVALSALMLDCHALNTAFPDAIVNVGRMIAGGPVNVVPDHAEAWLNIRASEQATVPAIEARLNELAMETMQRFEDISVAVKGGFSRHPKQESPDDARMHELWNAVSRELGHNPAGKRETGGSSDGNILGFAGLPHLDGVGIHGGKIHSENEFALLDSIEPQVSKVVGFMKRLAENPQPWINR